MLEQSFSDLAGSTVTKQDEQRRMRATLRATLAQGRKRVHDLFHAWDDNGDGKIDQFEFRRAVRALGFRSSACDATDAQIDGWIDELFGEFDEDRSGQLEYRELERKLAKIAGSLVEQRYNVRRSAGGRVGAALGTTVRLDRASGKPVSQLLSEELAKSSNLVRVIDLFRDWDENGDGAVSKDEFYQGMVALGLEVARSETNELFDSFDVDGSGLIDFREMNKMLRKRARPTKLSPLRRDPLAAQMPPGPARPVTGLVGVGSSGALTTTKSSSWLEATQARVNGMVPSNPWQADRMNSLCGQWLVPRHGDEWNRMVIVSPTRPLPKMRRTAVDPRGVLLPVM